MSRETKQRGFTVIELLIALALLGVVVVKLTLVITEASKTHRHESTALALEDQAQSVLDRISFAIVGADPDSLDPGVESPLFVTGLRYRISLGVEAGEVVWGDPEFIGLAEETSQLYWAQNRDTVLQRIVVWCNTVSELMERELANGADDNDNGLTDESGLTFDVDRKKVTIRLTLEREDDTGQRIKVTRSTEVTCRN